MADVLLLHHAQGRTPGMLELAGSLERAGHTVHTPDLYDGEVFDDLEAGIAHARAVGFDVVADRGRAAAADLPADLVYVGVSLGVMAAQPLAQDRPGARGAVLVASCVPPEEFGSSWPGEVPVQVHGAESDPIFAGEGDLDAARALVEEVPRGELFLYPGDQHLFMDASLPAHVPGAAALFTERLLAFCRDVS